MTAMGGSEVFRLFGTVEVDRARFAADMKAMERGVAGFATKMGRSMAKVTAALERNGKAMQSIGRGMSLGVTLPLLAAGGAALKFSNDLNEGMANVGTLIPGASERVVELREEIMELSVATGKSMGDLTEGLYQVISAFGDTADTEERLNIVTRAGVAGRASTTDALNLLSAVTKGYGDTSTVALRKASDLAFATVRMGQTTFPELASSMGRVIPIAESMGITMEELFAVMATGTGVTGSASEVATQFRGVLNSIMNPQKEMIALLEEYQYASGEAMLADLGLIGSLRLIKQEAEEGGFQMIEYITMVEALPIALALTGAQGDVFIEKLEGMTTATDESAAAFKEQTEGINATGFALTQLRRRVEVMTTRLGDGLAPALMEVAAAAEPTLEWLEGAAERFAELTPEVQKSIVKLGLFVAAIGPTLYALGGLARGMTVVKGLLSGPGGYIALLLALVYAQDLIYRSLEKVEGPLKRVADTYRFLMRISPAGGFLHLTQGIRNAVASLGEGTEVATTSMSRLNERVESGSSFMRQLGGAAETSLGTVNDLLGTGIERVNAFGEGLGQVWRDQGAFEAAALQRDAAAAAAAGSGGGGEPPGGDGPDAPTRVAVAQEQLAALEVEYDLAEGITAKLAAAKAYFEYVLAQLERFRESTDLGERAWAAMLQTMLDSNAEGMVSWEEFTDSFPVRMEEKADDTITAFEFMKEQIAAKQAELNAELDAMYQEQKEKEAEAQQAHWERIKEQQSQAAAAIQAIAERVTKGIANAWGRATAQLMVYGGQFKDFWFNLCSMMRQVFFQAISDILAKWLATTALMKGITGVLGGFLGLSEGGIITKPMLAVVGEKGPEAVIPLSSASAAAGAGVSGVRPLSSVSAAGGPEAAGVHLHGDLYVSLTADSLDPIGVARLGNRLVPPLGEALRTALLAQVTGG